MKIIRKKEGCFAKLERQQSKAVIGIIGSHAGAGVTTMAVAMANYMSSCLRLKTALCQYGNQAEIKNMGAYIFGDEFGDKSEYSYNRTDYYTGRGNDMWDIVSGNYEIVIVDFGHNMSSLNEFARCNHKIVMGGLEPWHMELYERFCDNILTKYRSDSWLHILHGDSDNVSYICRKYKIYGIVRPFIENPFVMDRQRMSFFQSLF